MQYRTVFLSDIHLGSQHSQAEALLDFMRDMECDTLFLVGDIIDGWALRRRWHWPQEHSDVVQKLLRRARKGTQIYYILGNHDEFVRGFLPLELGDRVSLLNEYEFTTLKGNKYLITHGDFFDSITMTKKWLAKFGDISYDLLLKMNKPINRVRRMIGYHRHWSLANFAKQNVKKAVMFIDNYENVLTSEAKRRDFDGVVCGHIHKAENRMMDGIHYLNCGDWVESCTAVVETVEGEWQVLHFDPSLKTLSQMK